MAEGGPTQARTTIDSLIELLRRKGKMDLASISSALEVDEGVIENWAKVLEKGNIVRITYEVGKMYVVLLTQTAEQETEAKSKIETKSVSLEEDSSSQALSLDKLSESLSTIKVSVAAAEKFEASQMPEVHKSIMELNKVYDLVAQRSKSVEQMAQRAEQIYDEVNKKSAELTAKLGVVDASQPSGKGYTEAQQAQEQLRQGIQSINQGIEEANKNANAALKQLKDSIAEQMRIIFQQVDQSRKEIELKEREYSRLAKESEQRLSEHSKAMRGVVEEAGEFNKLRDRAARDIKGVRNDFNNYYVKVMQELKEDQATMDSISKRTLAKMDEIKKAFGQAEEIDKTLSTLKSQVAEIEADIASAKKEVAENIMQLHALNSLSSLSTQQRASALQKMVEKSKKTAARVAAIRDKADKAATSVGRFKKEK